jgi:hypothetical protein
VKIRSSKLRLERGHDSRVKCATSVECQKLVYQSCSLLKEALGSSLIRDTLDSFMLMAIIMILGTFLLEEVLSFGNINLGFIIKLGFY